MRGALKKDPLLPDTLEGPGKPWLCPSDALERSAVELNNAVCRLLNVVDRVLATFSNAGSAAPKNGFAFENTFILLKHHVMGKKRLMELMQGIGRTETVDVLCRGVYAVAQYRGDF